MYIKQQMFTLCDEHFDEIVLTFFLEISINPHSSVKMTRVYFV